MCVFGRASSRLASPRLTHKPGADIDADGDTKESLQSELTLLKREHFHALVLSIKLALSTKHGVAINVAPDDVYAKLLRDDPDMPVAKWPGWIDRVLRAVAARYAAAARK